MAHRFRSRCLTLLAAACVMLVAAAAPAAAAHRRDVVANLFEWNWPSVAKECRTVLGPKGYGAVQVAPPQDSLSRTAPPTVHPWWEVYQPVDYRLFSRMGTPAQFRSMVGACRHAGVHVIVDAVINHMTGQGDVSYGGVHYSKYDYHDLYGPADFHHYPADCPEPDGTIHDFNNALEVFKCELVGLADLRTETSRVRHKIAAYLNKLLRIGVSGFRIDAAKHIGQRDLRAIKRLLHRTKDGTRPYLALEIGAGSPGRLAPHAFIHVGHVLGFDYAQQIHDAFKSYTTTPTGPGNITDLRVFGQASGLLPGARSLVFVENHDTERNGSTLSYKDGAMNTIATEFMLAWPYGRPEVYAGFAFQNTDDSPPANAQGFVTDTDCSHGWVCVDRYTGVANLVGWHNLVAGTRVRHWYDDGVNLIAFSRGHRGWIAINHEDGARTLTVQTGLPGGRYCDLVHGDFAGGTCSGPTVDVAPDGRVTATVGPDDAVAIDAETRLPG